jgi:hypothetical protein
MLKTYISIKCFWVDGILKSAAEGLLDCIDIEYYHCKKLVS